MTTLLQLGVSVGGKSVDFYEGVLALYPVHVDTNGGSDTPVYKRWSR